MAFSHLLGVLDAQLHVHSGSYSVGARFEVLGPPNHYQLWLRWLMATHLFGFFGAQLQVNPGPYSVGACFDVLVRQRTSNCVLSSMNIVC